MAQVVALQKISHRERYCFFAFAKLPNHWLFGILAQLTPGFKFHALAHVNQIKHSFRCGY